MATYVSTSVLGKAAIDPSYYWSKDGATISTGYGAVSQSSLQSYSGASANLDSVSASTWGGTSNVTEGSAIKSTIYLNAGDTVSWAVTGQQKDYIGDFTYASVAYKGASNGTATLWSNTKKIDDDGYGAYSGNDWNQPKNVKFTAAAAGYYDFTTGIVDVGDTVVDSSAFVLNFGQGLVANANSNNAIDLSPGSFGVFVPGYVAPSVDTSVKFLGNAKETSSSSGVYKLSTSDSGTATKSQADTEAWLSLNAGVLDTIENEGTSYWSSQKANATSGSAMKKYVKASAGDTIAFNYFWDGGDYVPYDDFAYVSLGGKVITNQSTQKATLYQSSGSSSANQVTYNGGGDSQSLVSIKGAGNYNDVAGTFEYKIKESDSYITDSSGNQYYELGIGITDEGDTVVDSDITISNLNVSSGGGWNSSLYSSTQSFSNFSSYSSGYYAGYSGNSSYSESSLQTAAYAAKSESFSSQYSQFTTNYSSSSYTETTQKQNTQAIAGNLTNIDFAQLSSSSSFSSQFDWNSAFSAVFNTGTLSSSLNVEVDISVKIQQEVAQNINWGGVKLDNVSADTQKLMFNSSNIKNVQFNEFSSSQYSSMDYSAVEWNNLDSTTYSTLDWSKVDFSSTTFSSNTFSQVNWSNVNTSQISSNTSFAAKLNSEFVGETTGFTNQADFNSFKAVAQSSNSALNFTSFDAIDYSSKSFSATSLASTVIDYSSVQSTSFKSFSKTAYSSFDWSSTSFVESLGSATSTAYSSLNYKSVDFAKITSVSSTAEAFAFDAVNYSKISKTSYSDISWSNFDFAEASSSSTFSKLKFDQISWTQVSSNQYSDISWSKSNVSKAFKSTEFSAASFFSSSSFQSYSAESYNSKSYKGIQWNNVDFTNFTSESYSNVSWEKVKMKQIQKGAYGATLDYNSIDYSNFSNSSYKNTEWSKVNYSSLDTTSYESISWNSVNYKSMFKSASSSLSTSTFSSVDYSQLNAKSVKQFASSAKKSSESYSSVNYQSVNASASTYTSQAGVTDVFDASKLKTSASVSSFTLNLESFSSTSSTAIGDLVILNKSQKEAITVNNFNIGIDQLNFAGLKGDVSFADTSAGAEVQANGNVYAVLAGVTAAQITGAAGYVANQGLGL